MQQCIKHTFAADDRLRPVKIEVNGRKNRRFVVVLGEDCRQMRIFDLDYKEGETVPGQRSGTTSPSHDDDDDEMMKE
jgi:anaphase-promoting complex subunit 4